MPGAESWLKFDTLVASFALLMSSITAGAMVYQTHVLEEQFAATIWPYVSVETTYEKNAIGVNLTNDGAGPALIRSAQLTVDGKPEGGWGDLVAAIKADLPSLPKGTIAAQMSSIDPSTTIRAGDSRPLIALKADNPRIVAAARRHSVALNLCYCSINDRCWTLRTVLGSNAPSIPQPAGPCRAGSSITSPSSI